MKLEDIDKANKDLVGKTFTNLLITEFIGYKLEKSGAKRAYYACTCQCGEYLEISRLRLITGNTKSCGCLNLKRDPKKYKNIPDYTGKKFGRLTAIERIVGKYKSSNGLSQVRYRCMCECGKEIIVPTGSIQSGNTKSCGCLNLDLIMARNHDAEIIAKRQLKASDHIVQSHWRSNEQIHCRGSWEANVVNYLNTNNIDFEWQIPFKLSDGRTYIIDLLDKTRNVFIEIKGWWRDDAKQKFDMFCIEYPNLKVEVWGKTELLDRGIPIRNTKA
jgi:hypothetical protein